MANFVISLSSFYSCFRSRKTDLKVKSKCPGTRTKKGHYNRKTTVFSYNMIVLHYNIKQVSVLVLHNVHHIQIIVYSYPTYISLLRLLHNLQYNLQNLPLFNLPHHLQSYRLLNLPLPLNTTS